MIVRARARVRVRVRARARALTWSKRPGKKPGDDATEERCWG